MFSRMEEKDMNNNKIEYDIHRKQGKEKENGRMKEKKNKRNE